MGSLETLTTADLPQWREVFSDLDAPGAYHDPDYLTRLAGNFEHADERAEAVLFTADNEVVYYPYIRRSLETVPFDDASGVDGSAYDDIVSSWYYGGPIASTTSAELAEAFLSEFDAYCREEGIVAEFVRFDPNLENHETFQCYDPSFNRETVPVDLTGSIEDVWAGYEGRNQRAIEQARNTDLVVEPTRDPADIDAFHRIYGDAMEAKDADEHYRFEVEFFQNLVRETPGLATLLVSRYDGDVIGGFVALHNEQVAHHYLSASMPEYWDLRVNNLLFHEVVAHFHERGFQTFDFQGGRPGVFKFKKGFSPNRREFHIATRNHLPDVYSRFVEAASEAGVDTNTDYFPAYRVEQSN